MAICCEKDPQACEVSESAYLAQIGHNLPRGPIWELDPDKTFTKFWQGFARVLTDANNYICQAINEFYPCTAETTIDRWANLLAAPNECFEGLTLEEKQEFICAYLGLAVDCRPGSIGFMQGIIDASPNLQGISLSEVQINSAQAGCFQAGCSGAAPSHCPNGLVVSVPSGHPAIVSTYMQAGCCWCAGELLCSRTVPEIDCLAALFVPYNVKVKYEFGCNWPADVSGCFFDFYCAP